MTIWSTDKGPGKKCESDLILTNNPYHSIITDINVGMVMMMNLETMMEKRMERDEGSSNDGDDNVDKNEDGGDKQ